MKHVPPHRFADLSSWRLIWNVLPFTLGQIDSQPAAHLLRGPFDDGQAGFLPKPVLSKP